jgi:homoserine/homoserine lactone efflux protein
VSWAAWAIFAITTTLTSLSPGPAVLFVVSHGVSGGPGEALRANAGILACNAVFFLLTAFGVGALLLSSHRAFAIVQVVGALYLIYLGIATLRGSGVAVTQRDGGPTTGGWRTTWRGVALQASNPKALLFFVALLPQFIDPRLAVAPQVAILGVTDMSIEFLLLAGYGYLAARAALLARQPRFVQSTNRLSGSMLILAGAWIAIRSTR